MPNNIRYHFDENCDPADRHGLARTAQ